MAAKCGHATGSLLRGGGGLPVGHQVTKERVRRRMLMALCQVARARRAMRIRPAIRPPRKSCQAVAPMRLRTKVRRQVAESNPPVPLMTRRRAASLSWRRELVRMQKEIRRVWRKKGKGSESVWPRARGDLGPRVGGEVMVQ